MMDPLNGNVKSAGSGAAPCRELRRGRCACMRCIMGSCCTSVSTSLTATITMVKAFTAVCRPVVGGGGLRSCRCCRVAPEDPPPDLCC